ncbi:MAG: gliding motility-associated C-terminal domain-containing protein [Flavobacteriales bacterium]|nr:gliding motility-associated C-terminal domain-containing protein [Flavobacteriales bacterium]
MLLASILVAGRSRAQCGTPIATFPYTEDFEGAPAWTTGGAGSDWAWGTPAHPTINTAGGGSKSWCVGGLTGTFYNYGELSWLQSPCFDMTNLDHPWVAFNIFWECERQYDGMVMQYSLNGGTTWSNVGAFNDPVNCLNANWYNSSNITNLTSASPKHGWSGRIGPTNGNCQGGQGSGGWVEAKHCLPACANQPQVILRFLFGAGTACNDYDGIAIDDVLIQEAPSTTAGFTVSCNGNTIDFTDQSTSCPSSHLWDFGDPPSGAANTSTLASPLHTYPAAGTYTVTLTVTAPCSAPSTISLPVTILGVNVAGTDAPCNGGTGSAIAQVTGSAPNLSYDWQPSGGTAATAAGLTPGNYTVQVSAPNACSATGSVTIAEPPLLSVTAMNDTTVCPGSTFQLAAQAAGGTPGYTYSWSPVGPQVTPTSPTIYAVTAEDAHGCTSAADQVQVDLFPAVQPSMSETALSGCAPLCVTFTDGTTGSIISSWDFGDGNTDVGVTIYHCYLTGGTFTPMLTVTDANGCAGSIDGPDITVSAQPIAIPQVQPALAPFDAPHYTAIDASVGGIGRLWEVGDPVLFSSVDPITDFTLPGDGCVPLTLIAYSNDGCADTARTEVCVESEYALYAPNAFTPNGDGINDVFRPISPILFPQAYDLRIFDRWGQEIFASADRNEGWDGTDAPSGVYVWTLRVRDAFGRNHDHRGHVVLVR